MLNFKQDAWSAVQLTIWHSPRYPAWYFNWYLIKSLPDILPDTNYNWFLACQFTWCLIFSFEFCLAFCLLLRGSLYIETHLLLLCFKNITCLFSLCSQEGWGTWLVNMHFDGTGGIFHQKLRNFQKMRINPHFFKTHFSFVMIYFSIQATEKYSNSNVLVYT